MRTGECGGCVQRSVAASALTARGKRVLRCRNGHIFPMSFSHFRGRFARAQACLIVTVLVAFAQSAHGSCITPTFLQTPPTPPIAGSRPDVPKCLSEYVSSGRHTCSAEELSAYRSAIREYLHQVATYAMAVASFANAARTFASEAQRFAKCEAGRAAAQHERPRP